MGWAGGAELAEGIWRLFRKYIPEKERTQVAKQLIEAFRDHDWDTVDEAEILATDAHWHNKDEYDAICVDTNSAIDDLNDANLYGDDIEYQDDGNRIPN